MTKEGGQTQIILKKIVGDNGRKQVALSELRRQRAKRELERR